MKLLPRTLIGRTAVLIALLIIISQVAWFGIVRVFLIPPLRAAHTNHIVSTIVMARTALEALPENQRQAFLDGVNAHKDFRIVPGDSPEAAFKSTREDLPADLETSLTATFGSSILLETEPKTHDLWIRFPVQTQQYWLVLSSNRIHPLFPLDLLIWIALGVIFAIIGAYLVIFRLDRQLHKVLEAARTIGRGETPSSLAETGPDEIRDLSRGFNQMAEGLQKLDSERRLMLAGISHDLRTPLTRLRIGIELAGNAVEPALSRGMIHDIEDMDSILMQFLDYARDGSEEAPQYADFNQIVFDVCQRHDVSGNSINTSLDDFPPFKFRKLAIRSLISNLVDNAIRYGGKGIEVVTQESKDRVVLKVMDRGPGIHNMEPNQLIKPFVRNDSARGNQTGAGLGLTIADRIARMHGGELRLSNRDGGGFTAIVAIPSQ
ncbi:MAG TPA: ATP-binding protein [Gammaproteobacteria bacterium]|nr:ATP-binding protein [Gammaproteobacteria bacterium]